MAEMCNKLESEQDHMLTPSSAEAGPGTEDEPVEVGLEVSVRSDTAGSRVQACLFNACERVCPVSVQERCALPELQQLMRRINTAALHREALKTQRGDLSRENQQLRLLLRRHLDAMTVSALDGPRALLTTSRAPTAAAPRDHSRRHTVVEAVHAAKHSL